jgi:hypothetical protein
MCSKRHVYQQGRLNWYLDINCVIHIFFDCTCSMVFRWTMKTNRQRSMALTLNRTRIVVSYENIFGQKLILFFPFSIFFNALEEINIKNQYELLAITSKVMADRTCLINSKSL